MKKPSLISIQLLFFVFFIFNLALIYVAFFRDEPVIKVLRFDSVFGAFLLVLISPWVVFYFVNNHYFTNLNNILNFGESSNSIDEKLRESITKLKEAYKSEIITKEEFRKKSLPLCNKVWQTIDKNTITEENRESALKKTKIIEAYNNGVLTKEEMENKINSL